MGGTSIHGCNIKHNMKQQIDNTCDPAQMLSLKFFFHVEVINMVILCSFRLKEYSRREFNACFEPHIYLHI